MPPLNEFERLFLLEFFVDYITIQNVSFHYGESTLCVSFQFLHYPVMRVCEEDFKPESRPALTEDSKIIFKSGKSCLFSVHSDEENKISSTFDLVIAVCQKKKECSSRCLIGQAAVNLGSSFTNLLQSPNDKLSDSHSVKYDLFPLKDKFKRVVGSVAAFTRLSNFGKIIITQFQLAAEDSVNYMFKGTDPGKLFKDDPMMDFPIILQEKRKESYQQDRPKSKQRTSLPRSNKKCLDSSESSSSSSSETSSESESELSRIINETDEESRAKLQEQDQNFKEIEAEINGHSITIRVIKKDKTPKPDNQINCCCPPSEPPQCPNLCNCEYPFPPQLMSQSINQNSTNQSFPYNSPTFIKPPQELPSQTPGNVNPSVGMPTELISSSQDPINTPQPSLVCPREDCPLGLYIPSPPPDPMDLEPGCIAMKGDQVIFQMANRPSGEPVNEKEQKLASTVYYTVGATDGGKETLNNVVQITAQTPQASLIDGSSDGPVSGLPVDNKQDMFLFKVFKGNERVSTSCKLEMELRTPKEKEIKAPASTVDTQYLVTDFPPVEKKGKKGKGKPPKKGGKKK